MQKISPFLWFDNNASEAINFYNSAFSSLKNSVSKKIEIKEEQMVIPFSLEGIEFTALNGGPHFKPNPSISFFVTLEDEEDVNSLWNLFLSEGKVLMPLQKYDWSEKYGWLSDKFGFSWQISLGKLNEVNNKVISPFLLFTGENSSRAEEAVNFYLSIFKESRLEGILKNGNSVLHAQFYLYDQTFMISESNTHNFNFNEAVSFVVNCEDQNEVDYYWEKLSNGGEESMCGWLKDKFGVSWQIVPIALQKLLADEDRSERVMNALLKMKKLDIKTLEQA